MAEPAFTTDQIKAAIQRVKGAPAEAPADSGGGFSSEDIQAAIQRVRATPAPRQSPLNMLERMAVSRAKDEPERVEKILKDRGFSTKRKGDEVLIDKAGKFVSWDPKDLELGDLFDIVPDALELGVAAAAGGAKVLGAVGAPATGGASLAAASALSGAAGAGLEGALQTAEKLGGVREEFDPGRIASRGLAAAAVPGAGKLVEKAGRGISKMVGKGAEKVAGKEVVKAAPKATPKKEIIDPFKTRRFKGDKVGRAVGEDAKVIPMDKLSAEASKIVGKKSAADAAVIATDVFRTLKGDPTPAIRRMVMGEIKKMSVAKRKALADAIKSGAEKMQPSERGLASISGGLVVSDQIDRLASKIRKGKK
jgi:hypothetical protein